MRRLFLQLKNLVRGGAAEQEMEREFAAHLALLQEDFERRGLSPGEAECAARREYGGVEQAKELHREARSIVWIEQRFKDIRYGIRGLLRTPGFTALAILTLALGIGANTAIFSVVNAVLLRPLAYQDPDRLVTILHNGSSPVAPANYLDWREQSHSFEAVGAAQYWSPNLTGTDSPEHLLGLSLSQNLLALLGVQPERGRFFAVGEDQKGAEHEIILSHGLWERRFGSDPGVLGRLITLNGEAYTIVGVMPAAFKFAPFWATHAELWVPLALGERAHDRGGNSLRVFARLKKNVSLTQARADIAAINQRLEKQFPGTNRDVRVTPLKENVVGRVQTPLLLVLGAVGFVLLIACANVAHMQLARTSDRQKEIAVRTALGASRSRVISQFLTESVLLAGLGGVTGLALAMAGVKALVALSPADIPRMDLVSIDPGVVAFLLVITLLTAIVFGLTPALHAAAANLSGALKEGGRGGSDSARRHRLRSFLVASEFALAFMLLIGAGLMSRSFLALQADDPGFDPHHVLSLVVSVAGSSEAEPGRREIFYRELLEKVRNIPGVQSAGAINHLPLAGDLWGRSFAVEGRPKPVPGDEPVAIYRLVMPGYFETMRLPIRLGRAMNESDTAHAPGVVVINERLAREHWPGEDPLGRRISLTLEDRKQPVSVTVVGVAANAKQGDWTSPPQPEVYLSARQNEEFMGSAQTSSAYLTVVLRTTGDPAAMTPVIKQAVWSFDKNLPISAVTTMDAVVASANAQPRFEMALLGVFAAVALVLATVGIYGVMNYAVARRTKEIGIRMSLGASRSEVLKMVLRQGLRQASAGTAVGIAGALLLSQLMTKMLYGVQPTDPLTFIGVALVLGAAAVLASSVPARRATRIEPVIALRSE